MCAATEASGWDHTLHARAVDCLLGNLNAPTATSTFRSSTASASATPACWSGPLARAGAGGQGDRLAPGENSCLSVLDRASVGGRGIDTSVARSGGTRISADSCPASRSCAPPLSTDLPGQVHDALRRGSPDTPRPSLGSRGGPVPGVLAVSAARFRNPTRCRASFSPVAGCVASRHWCCQPAYHGRHRLPSVPTFPRAPRRHRNRYQEEADFMGIPIPSGSIIWCSPISAPWATSRG